MTTNGTSADDIINGTPGYDNIYGLDGNDSIFGWGSGDDLRGGNGNDLLDGGEGNDQLDGGAGADTLIGGIGNDVYVVDDQNDQVIEIAGEGTDHVKALIDYTLGATLEHLTLLGSANLNGTGNAADNALRGNVGNNILSGLDGKDGLDGAAGDDRLIGGAGDDWQKGGAGADSFVFAAADVALANAWDQIADLNFSEGDRILLQGYRLCGIEGEGEEDHDGCDKDDDDHGDGHEHHESGGRGRGHASGSGSGNGGQNGSVIPDTVIASYADVVAFAERWEGVTLTQHPERPEHALITITDCAGHVQIITLVDASGAGSSWAQFQAILAGPSGPATSTAADANDRDGYSSGTTLFSTLSNAALNRDSRLAGTSGNDVIDARGGDDRVYASSGDDRIDGGQGQDEIYGGSGHDRINGEQGRDRLFGGSGDDRIDGGQGDDLIVGGTGADRLTGGSGDDVFRFLSGADSNDVITDFGRGDDLIDLAAMGFTGLAEATHFAAGRTLIWHYDGGNTVILGDTDGNFATAEFRLTLEGRIDLDRGDFIL